MRAVFRVVGLIALLGLFAAGAVRAEHLVGVGAYNFPPYVEKPDSSVPTGLLPDLLDLLNAEQSRYHFVLVPTSVTRRYRDMASGRIDMMLFESPEWGWKGTPHQLLALNIDDAEVYVALRRPGRGQDYFDSLQGKRLALYSGYHYGFAGFNADREFLRNTYHAQFSYSHDSNLQMVLHDRADIAVVTRSFLDIFRAQHPQQAAQLLVSDKTDQIYRHQVLLRPQAPISLEEFAALLEQVRASGKLPALLQRYQLKLR